MTRYIVTGAAGHLGSTVIRILLERGEAVRGLLLPSEQAAVPGLEHIRGDVLEPESFCPLFQRGEEETLVVIHTAGLEELEYTTRSIQITVHDTVQ